MDFCFDSLEFVFWVLIAQTHLLVMPPPGGSPGICSAARNLIT